MTTETLYEDIRAAFQARLTTFEAFASSKNIHWENSSFNPVGKAEWLAERLFWNTPTLIGAFSDAGTYREQGFYQVIVACAKGQGTVRIDDLVSRLRNHFQRGTTLTANGNTVKIERTYRLSGYELETWYKVPVTVEFWTYSEYRP